MLVADGWVMAENMWALEVACSGQEELQTVLKKTAAAYKETYSERTAQAACACADDEERWKGGLFFSNEREKQEHNAVVALQATEE